MMSAPRNSRPKIAPMKVVIVIEGKVPEVVKDYEGLTILQIAGRILRSLP